MLGATHRRRYLLHNTAASGAQVPRPVRRPGLTTAVTGPHRLMPVLVPAVVPPVPADKATKSTSHGTTSPREITLLAAHPAVYRLSPYRQQTTPSRAG